MSDVDKVANAMTRVCWQGHLTFDDYRRMAQAAIDVLNLTEESVPLMPPRPGKWRRLVGPWIKEHPDD